MPRVSYLSIIVAPRWTFIRTTIRRFVCPLAFCLLAIVAVDFAGAPVQAAHLTAVSIMGEDFLINGKPTYAGRTWNHHSIEGLLLNSRMVNGIFDDLNPKTVGMWAYPDTKKWDAERNTDEFVAAMASWRASGLLAFTINLQGGSPQGYSKAQPWINSAFASDGSLRRDYFLRLARVLDEADRLGMVVILGYFYGAQDKVLTSEDAVKNGVDSATKWVLSNDYTNVIIEINNECNNNYTNAILRSARVSELITRVKNISFNKRRLLASTSFSNTQPTSNVVAVADFILVHGNGTHRSSDIGSAVVKIRKMIGSKPKPIVFNEDDNYNFSASSNNMEQAVINHASWGFFDYRRNGESFQNGFQSIPADWKIDSSRKTDFFKYLKSITGF